MFENLKAMQFYLYNNNKNPFLLLHAVEFFQNGLADNPDNYRDLEEMLQNECFKPIFLDGAKRQLYQDEEIYSEEELKNIKNKGRANYEDVRGR